MSKIRDKLINYIKVNRVSTTELSDALSKSGSVLGVRPIDYQSARHKVGKIKCVFAYNNSNFLVHEDLKKVNANDTVIIFTKKFNNKSIIGDLIAKFTLLYKQASSIVVLGNVRDLPKLIKERYPIWCKGFNPVGSENIFKGNFPKNEKTKILKKFDGGIAVCDATGVVLVEKNKISQKLFDKIKFIEKQEDYWYHCLDVKKWDTKKIIVDKSYKK